MIMLMIVQLFALVAIFFGIREMLRLNADIQETNRNILEVNTKIQEQASEYMRNYRKRK